MVGSASTTTVPRYTDAYASAEHTIKGIGDHFDPALPPQLGEVFREVKMVKRDGPRIWFVRAPWFYFTFDMHIIAEDSVGEAGGASE